MRESRERHLLYLALCVALIPVLLMRDFTPSNELRYLSIADEALRNGTFFAFTNHGVPFTDKPPLYLWIVMLCRWLTGAHHMWLLGLFSLVPAILIARVIDRWTIHDMDAQSRSAARLMLITSGIFFVSAMTIRMDMLMSLFIVLALRDFWYMQSGEAGTAHCKYTFPIYVFLATFTKGPLGLIIPLFVTIVYLAVSGNIRHIFRYWGWRTWGILIILTGLWFLGIYAEGGSSFLHDFIVKQTVDRTFDATHHGQPFYYYLLTIWYILAPWSLLIIGIIVTALQPKVVRSGIQTFFLTASLTIFVVLSCVDAKLQIYMLPAVPFMVYAAAMFLPRFRNYRLLRLSLAIPAVIFLFALPLLIWSASRFTQIEYLKNGLIYAAATVLTLTGGNVLYHIYGKARENLTQIIRRIAGGIAMTVFVASWALPVLDGEVGYRHLCEEAQEVSSEQKIPEIRAWKLDHAENMDAYLGKEVKVMDKDKVPTKSANEAPFILLTNQNDAKYLKAKDIHKVGYYAVAVYK